MHQPLQKLARRGAEFALRRPDLLEIVHVKEVLPGEGGEGLRGAHAGHGERARARRLGRGGPGARAAAPGEIKVVRDSS